MSHPRYAVLYFPVHGRAEAIRVLLAALDLPFEDREITRDTWMSVKATLPLGQAPVLVEIAEDGAETMIPQSQAILRHLARVHGAAGRSEAEMLRADVVAETVYDLRAPLAPALAPNVRGKDPAGLKAILDEKLPPSLARLERLAQQGPGNGLFVNGSPTWADAVAFDALDALDTIAPAVLSPYPGLRRFLDTMRALPSLASYLANRRPSELAPLRGVLETGQAL